MWGVLDPAGAHEGFIGVREEVVHVISTDEDSRAERDVHFLARAVVVAERLPATGGDADGHEGGYAGRVEVVEGGVDMPAVEAGVCKVILFGDGVFVKGLVMGMDQGDVLETFVRRDEPVPIDLHLGLVRDCLQVWMEDAAFSIEGFAMAVSLGGGVEALRELILGLGGYTSLAFEDDYMFAV